jgi:hypothetical protein
MAASIKSRVVRIPYPSVLATGLPMQMNRGTTKTGAACHGSCSDTAHEKGNESPFRADAGQYVAVGDDDCTARCRSE